MLSDGPAFARKRALSIALFVLAGLSICLVLARGFFKTPVRRIDAKAMVVAGTCWIAGHSPYRSAEYDACWIDALDEQRTPDHVFAYPPVTAAFLVPLAVFGARVGETLLDVLNIAAFLFALFATARIISRLG